jgi:hypothetical protein
MPERGAESLAGLHAACLSASVRSKSHVTPRPMSMYRSVFAKKFYIGTLLVAAAGKQLRG